VPLTAQSERVIDAPALAKMRPGAHIVNVSRGALIDTAALVAALDSGQVGGAAVDVLETEPPVAGDPLVGHPRVLISPHAAYYSDRAAESYVLDQARNVAAWLHDGRPRDAVVSGTPERSGRRAPT
jgi:phosphoglycerate dehydrogenase-like enzyme